MLEAVLVSWGLAQDASPVDATARTASFSVAYRADADCPSQATFQAAILARSTSAKPTDAATAEVQLDVELRAQPNQRRRLRVALDDGSSQDREIDADDCSEAMQSMAVIAAMILEARAREGAPPTPPPPPKPAEPVPATEAASPPSKPTPSVAPPSRAARPTWLGLSLGIGAESAAAPSPLFAPSVGLELGSVTEGVLSPSVRLGAVLGQGSAETSIGDARFRLAIARLHACGLRWGSSDAELRLCAVLDGGGLFGQGVDALNERSQAMLWLGAGLAALGSLSLGERKSLELGGGGRALVVRDHFVFSPDTSIHQVPDFAWDFHLALNYRLW